MHPLVEAELAGRSAIDPHIPFRARPNHSHATWARTFSSLPELYLQPSSLPEIHKIIRLARLARRRIVVTGCCHSPSTLTCSSAWNLNLDSFNRVLSVTNPEDPHNANDGEHVVEVEAGIRLYQLCDELEKQGLALPNLGSINEQSLAGAISTGTHGSTLHHGLLSASITSLRLALADGKDTPCSPTQNPELFRAALLSLGALGIITHVSIRVVPSFALRWRQTIDSDRSLFASWTRGDLWLPHDFVRVWWFPYTRRAVVWHADRPDHHYDPATCPPPRRSYYDGRLGYYVYHNLLYAAQWLPRILPFVEWFVFGMQYGFRDGTATGAVQPSRDALLMNCLYPQFVNEWAIPLHKGPLALRRLGAWLNNLPPSHPDYVPHGIPFSAEGLWVHAPVEVRVSDTSRDPASERPFLDPTVPDGPTLYLNATLYRPYWRDPPCRTRYYEAFEWLMRDMGGRPHWAKNFETARPEIEEMYGEDLVHFRRVRDEADPEGMFLGPWHREKILAEDAVYELEEREAYREKSPQGITVYGAVKE